MLRALPSVLGDQESVACAVSRESQNAFMTEWAAIAIAVIALLTSFVALYLEHLRQFGVACHLERVFLKW